MVDREKVIKGLERCKLYNKVNCDKCPYDYNGRGNGKSECTAELASDAIAMLKEQEVVEPKRIDGKRNHFIKCGNCNKVIEMDGWIACPWCGKPIAWNEWWNKNGGQVVKLDD